VNLYRTGTTPKLSLYLRRSRSRRYLSETQCRYVQHTQMPLKTSISYIFLYIFKTISVNHLEDSAGETAVGTSPELLLREQAEGATMLYKRLQRQRVLRGFGTINKETYPSKAADMPPIKLEQTTGLSMNSLTPRERPAYWRNAGTAFVILQIALGQTLHFDPLTTSIPLTLGLLTADQLLLRGAVAESLYQKAFPEYKNKIIAHEAGHFLVAYLLGLSLRGCIVNAWDAKKFPEIRGQAGTIFYDKLLEEEMTQSRVTRTSLDRFSIVVMAGIAAEALSFNRAEGGADDERQLIKFFTDIQPPWNLVRIQSQARWAVVQAFLLIKEHKASYDALVKILTEKAGTGDVTSVGDLVQVIEKNLPSTLPSESRLQEKENRRKKAEVDLLLRYVQKMTWRAGGLDQSEPRPETEYQEENMMDAVSVFAKKMKALQEAAKTGDIDIPALIQKDSSRGGESGGLWLNGLQSRGSLGTSNSFVNRPKNLAIPPPLDGYEERLADLNMTDTNESVEVAEAFDRDLFAVPLMVTKILCILHVSGSCLNIFSPLTRFVVYRCSLEIQAKSRNPLTHRKSSWRSTLGLWRRWSRARWR